MNSKLFLKEFETRVKKTISSYHLLNKKEKVLVACSGGKDSTVALYLLKRFGYNVEAITVDALIGNYTKQNLENLRGFCSLNQVKLHEISFRKEFGYSLCYLKSVLESKGVKLTSCTICGVLRRQLLNKYARQLKAKKIVTGHNLDDEAQNIMMNLLRGNSELLPRLGPRTGLVKFKRFVPRVKPLYFCSETEVEQYSKAHKFPVKYTPCPCGREVYRNQISKELKKLSLEQKKNIVKNFLQLSPTLKKKFITTELPKACNSCGEPSKQETCQACNIVGKLKN